MKVGLCQTEIVWQDKQKNLEKAREWMEKGASAGADLLLFPEMSFTGFSMDTAVTGETSQETVDHMRELAVQNQVAAGFGWVKKTSGKAENHYTVVDEEGAVLSDYVKIHPFSYSGEDRYFQGGSSLAPFSLLGHGIGTLVCYDLRFPELFQKLADSCDVIAVAANWPAARREHWLALLKARAIETQAYLIGVNCCGYQKGVFYSGDSAVFGPNGEQLFTLAGQEEILYAEIGDGAFRAREVFPVRQDRRMELYREFYRQ